MTFKNKFQAVADYFEYNVWKHNIFSIFIIKTINKSDCEKKEMWYN